MNRRHTKSYTPYIVDTETPYLAIGGTVFGPHDGKVRRSFVLAFAPGGFEFKEERQRMAKALADRLNAEPEICRIDPPMGLVEALINQYAPDVIAEHGGSFQLNAHMF